MIPLNVFLYSLESTWSILVGDMSGYLLLWKYGDLKFDSDLDSFRDLPWYGLEYALNELRLDLYVLGDSACVSMRLASSVVYFEL